MKKLFVLLALTFSTFTAIDSHSQIVGNYEKETVVTFAIKAKHPSAKKNVAILVESMFGISFQSAMKMLNNNNAIVVSYKTGETKPPQASIKSALEAAGAEVEVK